MKATKKTKPLEYFLEASYPITVYSAPEGGYVAEIEDLPGCLAEGESLEEAFDEIEATRRSWIELQYEEGEDIPVPRTDKEYSGKFVVRIPTGMHKLLSEHASREGVSLNQYVNNLLASLDAAQEIKRQIIDEIRAQTLVPLPKIAGMRARPRRYSSFEPIPTRYELEGVGA